MSQPSSLVRQASVLLTARARTVKNLLTDVRRDSVTKTIVVAIGLSVIVAIGYVVSLYSMRHIENFPAFGTQLNSRLLGLLFLVLFTMVALSTAIVSYTSLFVAQETGYFFQKPISPTLIFFFKSIESTIFAGWATLLLCAPVLVAFGVVRDAPVTYYFEATVALFVFLLFCGLFGTALTVILLGVVRRWTLRKLMFLGGLLLLLIGWQVYRSFDFASFDGENNLLALDRFTTNLNTLQAPFMPSTWAASGLLAASAGQHREFGFNLGLLLANALIFIPILRGYSTYLYDKKWLTLSEPRRFWSRRERPAEASRRERFGRGTPGPDRALLTKDALSFVRSPTQISQFVLFLILTTVYVLSLSQIPSEAFPWSYRMVLFFSNIAAICLILSSFTSRFLFPLLSLEGRAFWIIGLAPIERGHLVRQKIFFGRIFILTVALVTSLGSNLALGFDWGATASAVFLTLLGGWLLTAYAVGFGAAYPNMNEDNPARIAVGLGGTLNFFASAISVLLLIGIESIPYWLYLVPPPWMTLSAHVATFAVTGMLSWLATRTGERALARMEF